MKIIKHDFSWEDNESHKIFWEHATERKEQANNEVNEIVKLFNFNPTETSILDVGCGLGYHMQALGQLGYNVVGTEVSDFSYERAKQNVQTVNGQVYKVLAKDMTWNNQFDLAIAIYHTLGYMSIEELYIHLEKIKNAIKQGGSFILNVPYTLESSSKSLPINKWTMQGDKYILVDKYVTEDNYKIEKCVIVDVNAETVEEFYEKQRYYYSYEIRQILEQVGFRDIQILKNFSGDRATNGEEANIYLCKK